VTDWEKFRSEMRANGRSSGGGSLRKKETVERGRESRGNNSRALIKKESRCPQLRGGGRDERSIP